MPPSKVYVEYDPDSPPPHPGKSWTRFICISDTHSRAFAVPPGDVLLHAGDLSSWGRVEDLQKCVRWIITLSHPVKILIAGNHDLCLDKQLAEEIKSEAFFKNLKAARELLRGRAAQEAGIHYLEHEAISIECRGRLWKIYGSPAAPRYSTGAFQYETREQAQEIYNQVPIDTDILLTHTPPYGHHDLTKRNKHAGCAYLSEKVQQLDQGVSISQPGESKWRLGRRKNNDQTRAWACKLHVWGHIHEAHGASIIKTSRGDRVLVNAALYHSGLPIIVDLFNGGKPPREDELSDAMGELAIENEDPKEHEDGLS